MSERPTVDEKGKYTAAVYERAIADAKEDEAFRFNELAALFEFDGGATRREAETLAAYWMLHGKMPPPVGIPE